MPPPHMGSSISLPSLGPPKGRPQDLLALPGFRQTYVGAACISKARQTDRLRQIEDAHAAGNLPLLRTALSRAGDDSELKSRNVLVQSSKELGEAKKWMISCENAFRSFDVDSMGRMFKAVHELDKLTQRRARCSGIVEKLGPLVWCLPADNLWPVIVAVRMHPCPHMRHRHISCTGTASVSLSIESMQVEATSIDHCAMTLLLRFAEANQDTFKSPEGLPLQFVRWNEDLGYEASKATLAEYRCVVLMPYDFAHFKLPEFVAMGMPIFMHSQLWKWTVRWSQLIARPGGRNASKHRAVPETCYEGSDVGLPLPSMPAAFWEQPWSHRDKKLVSGDKCLEGLVDSEPAEGPFGWSPFSLFTRDREHLQPLDSAAFWSRWSEMALVPHTLYFESASQLIALLRTTSLEKLRAVSRLQRVWHRRAAFQVVDFWRGLIGSLLNGDASRYKGPN